MSPLADTEIHSHIYMHRNVYVLLDSHFMSLSGCRVGWVASCPEMKSGSIH